MTGSIRATRGHFAFVFLLLASIFLLLGTTTFSAQNTSTSPSFTQINALPISSNIIGTGAAWVDYDGDGDLDLSVTDQSFTTSKFLFRNEGDGTFVQLTGLAFLSDPQGYRGISWGDYDRDGDLDVALAGNPNSSIYRNDGQDQFTRILNGDLGSASGGWSPAWGDANNDGYLDLFIAHPAGFAGPTLPNRYYVNSGPPDFIFTRDDSQPQSQGTTSYTIGNWTDFDLDGDQDLFVGAGPASSFTGTDFFYKNLLNETGEANFERLTSESFAQDRRDGQSPNLIDYDNDGDFDLFITNWGGGLGGGLQDDLYRNDAGVYTKITSDPLVNARDVSLANIWGDYDNDGDLDVYISNGNGGQPNKLYVNNGDGTFTRSNSPAINNSVGVYWSGTAGDYDRDGDLDLFIPNQLGSGSHLFLQNNTNNGFNWINLKLVGTESNTAALGARVVLEAAINGQNVSQMREITAQNSFLGHNSFNVHFGLGNAALIDSITVHWPSGAVDRYLIVVPNQFLTLTEGESPATP